MWSCVFSAIWKLSWELTIIWGGGVELIEIVLLVAIVVGGLIFDLMIHFFVLILTFCCWFLSWWFLGWWLWWFFAGRFWDFQLIVVIIVLKLGQHLLLVFFWAIFCSLLACLWCHYYFCFFNLPIFWVEISLVFRFWKKQKRG